MEVLITIVIVGITVGGIAVLQRQTWGSTRSTNNMILAGQLVQRQVEQMRMDIAVDSATYFPPRDSSFLDPESRINLQWAVDTVHDPANLEVQLVRRVLFTATWRSVKPETLTVSAIVSRDF